MNGLAGGLILLTMGQLLLGLGLRNQAMAARSMAEVNRRHALSCEEKGREYAHLTRALTSPERVLERWEWNREQERRMIPEL